jgi:hypothetical protein
MPQTVAPPPPNSKLGLYGKGSYDVTKARADAKKALEDAAKNFSKTKAYNCTIQPQPPKPQASSTSSKMLGTLGKAAIGALAKQGGKAHPAHKDDHAHDDHAHDATANHPSSTPND